MPKGKRNPADPMPGSKENSKDTSPTLSNSAARAGIIRDAVKKIVQLKADRASINADIAEIKNRWVKADLGFKSTDFDIAIRLYELEGDDRDELLDTIKETFAALGVGMQSNFLDAMEQEEPKSDPSPADAYDMGEAAALEGLPNQPPFDAAKAGLRTQWSKGWNHGIAKRTKEMAGTEATAH